MFLGDAVPGLNKIAWLDLFVIKSQYFSTVLWCTQHGNYVKVPGTVIYDSM